MSDIVFDDMLEDDLEEPIKTMNLTDEELRIKVAEAMGWRSGGSGSQWGDGQTFGVPPKGADWHWQETPNYPQDFNACAEFEQTLTDKEWPEYIIRLSGEEMGEGWPTCYLNLEAVKIVASATARQRCIAYLKTKGILP